MSRVGQISIARPGFPLQLRFDESEIKTTIEQDAQPGDHVTLYPGDYTTWYEDTSSDEDTSIQIEEGVSVTILPGAKVEYEEQNTDETFRQQEFTHKQEPFDSLDDVGNKNHPLSDGSALRYKVPNFTGHVENISDTNLASEWAFESDVEALRDTLAEAGTAIQVTTASGTVSPEVGLGQKFEFVEGPNVTINVGETTDDDGNKTGVGVNIAFDENAIAEIDGGKNINVPVTNGQATVNHDEISLTGPETNTGASFIQSVSLNNGHIEEIVPAEVATINNREPRSDDGLEGDIWFTKTKDFLVDIYLSPNDPTDLNGEEGDLWMVDPSFENQFRKAGNFFFSDSPPSSSEGENGAVWLEIGSWNGTNFETRQINEVIFNTFPPTNSEGSEGDVQATKTTVT